MITVAAAFAEGGGAALVVIRILEGIEGERERATRLFCESESC